MNQTLNHDSDKCASAHDSNVRFVIQSRWNTDLCKEEES
jgi:hypothetical protein